MVSWCHSVLSDLLQVAIQLRVNTCLAKVNRDKEAKHTQEVSSHFILLLDLVIIRRD
jgi:hypothetical protein